MYLHPGEFWSEAHRSFVNFYPNKQAEAVTRIYAKATESYLIKLQVCLCIMFSLSSRYNIRDIPQKLTSSKELELLKDPESIGRLLRPRHSRIASTNSGIFFINIISALDTSRLAIAAINIGPQETPLVRALKMPVVAI